MLVSTAYRNGLDMFTGHSDVSETDVRDCILAVLGSDARTLISHLDTILSAGQVAILEQFLTELKTNKPLAYILGYADFGTHRYQVEPGVLIPRPDTEVLIEGVSSWLDTHQDSNPLIVELGLGTGIVSLELASRFPELTFYGWEVDATAFQVASYNQSHIAPRNTHFFHQDFFSQEAIWRTLLDPQRPTLVISNPPYIPQSDIQTLDPSVRDYEPHMALDGGHDGLDVYRQLLAAFSTQPQTTIYIEIGYDQKTTLATLGNDLDWPAPTTMQDMAGRDRVMCWS